MKSTRASALALAAVVATVGGFGDARADVSARLPKIAKLHEDIVRAGAGPTAYLGLRQIWQEWDRGEPLEVEEAVREVAADGGEPAPIRAYAKLLESYARRRRGDLEGARARLAGLGYVERWDVVGPFDNEGKGGLDFVYEPENGQQLPIDLTHGYDGKEHHPVKWRPIPAVSPYAWLDLSVFVRPNENQCTYAVTFVRDARTKQKIGERTISVWAGAAGAFKLWWNGVEILKDDKYRNLDSDRFAAQVTLRIGWNRLMAKVCGAESGGPMISLRVAGPDGAPDEHLEVDADPAHSTMAGGATPPLGRGAPAAPAGGDKLEGSIEAFDRLARGDDPAALEAYARFMTMTAADDPAEHRARDMATRAAERAPTVQRLLLAGEMAENRNQRAVWIEKAEALVKRGGASEDDVIATLLARAAHAATGTNWRDAVPYYDEVLSRDPDNVPATLARVEILQKAGLTETAMAVLDRALARRPKSIALLRAMVASLQSEQRTTEAGEVAERYAELRFDDPTFARTHIDLAVARRDPATASRWIDRLLATNPDSFGALSTGASAYVALGDRAKAIALLRRALDLAPEDTDAMRELANVYALAGQRDEQLKLLKQVLALKPQSNDVREYVGRSEKPAPKPDELYARPASEFLAMRGAPSDGHASRTLVNLQVSTVFANGLASRFHQIVFQPMNDAAAAQSVEYDFGYEAESQAVQLRGAHVYRADGKVEDAIESGEGAAIDDPSMSMYTSARAYYVRFPRINPGDVVEIQYRVEDIAQRNVFADYFGEVTYMQSSDPIARAEYVLITPKTRTFYFNQPNVPGLQKGVEEKGDDRIFHFLAQNVPAIDPEPHQPPYSEILGHVHVSTYKTWDDMAKWYWGLVKDQFNPDDEVRRRVAELTKGLTDDRAKVRAIYDYVVQKTRYVALEFGIMGFKPYRCAQIFARGFGDCKDKATLIVTMLKELGIPATIVIVRSGMKGLFEKEPASLAPFDHAIAYVPSLDLYLDGTAEYTGSTELPAMDRGALALQVNEGNAKLVNLPDPPASESVKTETIDATVAGDGSARIAWKVDVTGVEAARWRVGFHADATRKQRLQQTMGGLFPGAEIGDIAASNLEDVEAPVMLSTTAKAPQFARKNEGALVIPLGPAEFMVKDYAPLPTRKSDLRFGPLTTTAWDYTVKLPPGATIKTGPTAASGSSPFGSYRVEVETKGTSIHVKTTITKTRSRVAASEYAAFQAFCQEVDRALAQRAIANL